MATNITLTESFDKLGLPKVLVRYLHSRGLYTPLPVQQRAILPMLQGQDVMVVAPAAEGKSTSAAICTVTQADSERPVCQSVFILPHRHCIGKVEDMLQGLGGPVHVRCYAVTGGSMSRDEKQALECADAQIVIGSAGHIFNMLRRKDLDAGSARTLVVDEVDTLLEAGQGHLVGDILHYLPTGAQVVMLSRAVTPELYQLHSRVMPDALVVDVT